MGKFDVFLKTGGLNKLGNTRAYNEEFSTELYDKVFNAENAPPFNSYRTNGISVNETTNPLHLVYTGLLAKSGAQDVYVVIGYGDNRRWEDIEYYKMNPTGYQTFELMLPIRRAGTINIAFKDSAENWDNNSGNNYVFNNHFYKVTH